MILLLFFIVLKLADRIIKNESSVKKFIPKITDKEILKASVKENEYSLLLFINPYCEYCENIINEIIYLENTDITIISNKGVENNKYLEIIGNSNIEFIASDTIFEEMGLKYVPYVSLLNSNSEIMQEKTVKNYSEILKLTSTTFI